MHIHPPKPLHGWKEFLNEIVIIVIGVLIALGFEQVVEDLHWQHKVHEGEELLESEAQRNLAMSLQAYVVSPCVDAQIELIRQNLSEPLDSRKPLPRFVDKAERFVIRQPGHPVFTSNWQSLIADGTMNHMPRERVSLWGPFYQAVEKNSEVSTEALGLGDQFAVLANPVVITPDERLRLMEKAEQLAVAANRSRSVAIREVDWYRQLGLEVPDKRIEAFISHSATASFCRSHGLPLADWRKALTETLPPLTI
ncbi:MAG: hypothetical protein WCL10_07505 [Novosphingobium sp.]|uniref:hypothetical protein n=1 Tax=Novosphingobium sp. TaxID=1874826 RepID=UPI00301B610B